MKHSELISIFIKTFENLKEIIPLNQARYYQYYSNSADHFVNNDRIKLKNLSPRSKHHNILHVGGGLCGEFAEALEFELRMQLSEYYKNNEYSTPNYWVSINSGTKIDHAFVYFYAKLDHNTPVYYRLDAWSGDYERLSNINHLYNQYDSKWGFYKIIKLSNHETPLTTNPYPPKSHTSQIRQNRNPYLGKKDWIWGNNQENIIEKLCLDLYIKETQPQILFFNSTTSNSYTTSPDSQY
ncbi:hypothetical protein L3V83_08370 [Thiotrichales bacterium 19X7-9]|nr:hypothetical protein [Thiotrichales bacterium 19X7-9]